MLATECCKQHAAPRLWLLVANSLSRGTGSRHGQTPPPSPSPSPTPASACPPPWPTWVSAAPGGQRPHGGSAVRLGAAFASSGRCPRPAAAVPPLQGGLRSRRAFPHGLVLAGSHCYPSVW